MIPETPMRLPAVAISAYVIAVSGYLWIHRPQQRRAFMLAMLVIGVASAIRYAMVRKRVDGPASWALRRKFARTIIVAGLLMAIPLTRQLGI